jgi:hypothetical protein
VTPPPLCRHPRTIGRARRWIARSVRECHVLQTRLPNLFPTYLKLSNPIRWGLICRLVLTARRNHVPSSSVQGSRRLVVAPLQQEFTHRRGRILEFLGIQGVMAGRAIRGSVNPNGQFIGSSVAQHRKRTHNIYCFHTGVQGALRDAHSRSYN